MKKKKIKKHKNNPGSAISLGKLPDALGKFYMLNYLTEFKPATFKLLKIL